MNKLIMMFSVVCTVSLVAFAQSSDNSLIENAASPVVQKVLSQPDGVAITLKDDGSFQIFARGTGTYDFEDEDDLNEAKTEGALKAKAALAKFLKEDLATTEGLSNVSKKTKSMTTDGQVQSKSVSKEQVKTMTSAITNSAAAILTGVITLREEKVPGAGSAGKIQVTVGISSKTLLAANKLANGIVDSLNNRNGSKGSQAVRVGKPVVPGQNKAEVRQAETDF